MKRRNLGYRVLTGKTSVATKNYKVPQDIPSQRLHQWSVASSKNSWGTLIHAPASASFVKSFSNFSFVMLAFHTMSPNFRHATMCDKTFLCFNADQKFYVSVLDTRWFHIFTIMSNALTNTGVQMSCWDPNSNSSRYRLRSEISGSHGGGVVIYLFFFEGPPCCSALAVQFYIPLNSVQGFWFLPISASTWPENDAYVRHFSIMVLFAYSW